MVKRHADAGNSSVRTIPAEKPTVESKQVVPDPVPSVLNQWTLDTETSSAFSGKRFRGNAITCNGKLVGKLVGFSEENANLVVASVNHSAKLAEALRESVSAMERMDARLLKLCDKGEIVRSKQALAAYEAAQ